MCSANENIFYIFFKENIYYIFIILQFCYKYAFRLKLNKTVGDTKRMNTLLLTIRTSTIIMKFHVRHGRSSGQLGCKKVLFCAWKSPSRKSNINNNIYKYITVCFVNFVIKSNFLSQTLLNLSYFLLELQF